MQSRLEYSVNLT